MVFTQNESRKALDAVYSDIMKLLRNRLKNDPESTLDLIEQRLDVARIIMDATEKKKKKRTSKKRKLEEAEAAEATTEKA